MAKLAIAGTYIHDCPPVNLIEDNISEARIRTLAEIYLGVTELERWHRDDWFVNKGFVDLTDIGEETLALYNHDGTYSVRTYRKKP